MGGAAGADRPLPDHAALLERFEAGLDPQALEASQVPARVVGYGEISVIFEIEGAEGVVFKRLPIFADRGRAAAYRRLHADYCRHLATAGLALPAAEAYVVGVAGRPVCLYIAQQKLPPGRLCHRLLSPADAAAGRELIGAVVDELEKVWRFNRQNAPRLELAIDGQLSNWALAADDRGGERLYYIDTSTPLMRVEGAEQLDPEPLLKSTPGFLRWIIRRFFLSEVMDRYYVPRLVYVDLVANLYKEQLAALVPEAVSAVNRRLGGGQPPLSVEEIERYYRQDKLIWEVFLRFRRFDRFLKTRLLRRRYEFILPGRIAR